METFDPIEASREETSKVNESTVSDATEKSKERLISAQGHQSENARRHKSLFVRHQDNIKVFTIYADEAEIPITNDELPYWYFNQDFYSSDREYKEVEDICIANKEKLIDVRPYIIETPFIVQMTDRMQKVNDMFRFMQLRAMCVQNPATGMLEGIITRQDIFAYMHL